MKILRTPTHRYYLNEMQMKRPIIDVPTRWSSTFKMLSSFKELRPYWIEHLADMPDSFMEQVDQILTTLRPVNTTTLNLQKEQLPLGDFVKLWWELRLTLEGMECELSKKFYDFFFIP